MSLEVGGWGGGGTGWKGVGLRPHISGISLRVAFSFYNIANGRDVYKDRII